MKRLYVVLMCVHSLVYTMAVSEGDKKAATEHLVELLKDFSSRDTKARSNEMLQDIADALVYGATFTDAKVDVTLENAYDGNRTLFDYAIEHQHWNLALIIFRANSHVGFKQDEDGRHLLHILALHEQAELTEELLKLDINPDPVDTQNETPLHYAARNGNAKIAAILLKHKANKFAHNSAHKTPRMLAEQSRRDHCVESYARYSEVLEVFDKV